jgi:hypothetical protein
MMSHIERHTSLNVDNSQVVITSDVLPPSYPF